MNFRNTFRIFIVMTAVGCGFVAPQAIEQNHDQNVAVPANEQEWTLLRTPFSTTLRGSTVFWAHDSAPEDMAVVVNASRNIRAAKGATVRWQQETLLPLQQQLLGVSAKIAEVQANENIRLSSVRREMTANWVEMRLKQALDAGVIVQSEFDDAMSVFSRYCEAKIWEFAASRAGADRFTIAQWSERPTPSQVCEGVYRRLGLLLPEANSCRDGQSNFMACIMNEGVAKTSLFRGNYENRIAGDVRSKAEILSSWIDSGTWSYLLQASNPERTKVATSLLKQTQPKPALFCRDFNTPSENLQTYCSIFVPDSGEPTDLPNSALDKMSPRFLISQLEDLSLSIGANEGGLAIAEHALLIAAARQDESKRILVKEIRELISAFGKRDSLAASMSDVLFNPVREVSALGVVKGLELRLAVPSVADIMRAGAGDEQKVLADLRLSQVELRAKIESAKSKLAEFDLAWTSALQAGAEAATKEGVSQAFAPKTELSLEFDGGILAVKWAISDKGDPIFSGCAGEGCGDGIASSVVEYDEVNHTLNFAIDASRLEASLVSLTTSGPRTDGFSLIRRELLEAAAGDVTIQLGRVSNEIIAGGTLVIEPEAGHEIRASMSLMQY